jgi:hypothetical protein
MIRSHFSRSISRKQTVNASTLLWMSEISASMRVGGAAEGKGSARDVQSLAE